MSKNVRISLYILIPVIAWMISGQFVEEATLAENGARERVSDRGGGTDKVATSAGRPTFLQNLEQTKLDPKLPEILRGNDPQAGTQGGYDPPVVPIVD